MINKAMTGAVIRATGILVIKKEVEVVFRDNGVTCIEDQAVERMREKIGLVPWDKCEANNIKCYTHND